MWCVERRWVVSVCWGVQGVSVVDCGVQGQDAAVGLGEDGLAQGVLSWLRLRW